MVQLGELMMILELHRHGLSVTAIARRTGRDPKTVGRYIGRGVEALVYGPRSVGWPSKLAPFMGFPRERVVAFSNLSAARLTLDIRELGYMAAKRLLAAIRPENGPIRGAAGCVALSLSASGLPTLSGEDEGKVERPFSHIRQDFFLGRSFRYLDDLNAQPSVSDRTRRVVEVQQLPSAAGSRTTGSAALKGHYRSLLRLITEPRIPPPN